MPVRQFQLLGFEDIMLLRDDLLTEGSIHWLLARHADLLFPKWVFEGWRSESRIGRPGWPAELMMGLVLLRYTEEGTSRVGSVRRAKHDAQWRAALRLPWREAPPDEKIVREFEAFLKAPHPTVGEPRIQVLFEHWTRLALDEGVVDGEIVPVIDSTPMWCFGAVLDTVNLLGEGLRSLGRRWARARGVPLEQVATEWGLPLLLAKSAKGHFEVADWRDPDARSAVLSKLAEAVNCGVEQITRELEQVRQSKRPRLAKRCQTLLRVVAEDLTVDEDGRTVVVRRQTSDRIISLTEPEAQHFRKSKSKVCSGFKLHVLGEAVSGLILALSVTPGGQHDSTQAAPLITRAKTLLQDLEEVLADSAYGGMPTRQKVQQSTGIVLLAPPPSAGSAGKLGKKDFDIDFDVMQATCPGGVATSTWRPTRSNGEIVPTFSWPVGSEEACSRREECPAHRRHTTKKGQERGPKRRLQLHPQEQELRRLRARWETPEVRSRYRLRSQGERLIHQVTRRGGRQARAWGLASAELQAYAIAAVNNLLLLAGQLAARSQQRAAA
jgi:IS5 family transposase